MAFALSIVGKSVLADFIVRNIDLASGPTLEEAEARLEPYLNVDGEQIGLQVRFNVGEYRPDRSTSITLNFSGIDVVQEAEPAPHPSSPPADPVAASSEPATLSGTATDIVAPPIADATPASDAPAAPAPETVATGEPSGITAPATPAAEEQLPPTT